MAIDIIARALALSGGGGGGGGTSDYNNLSNRPQINGVLLRGNKTGEDLGLVGIEVVATLPADLNNETIYVVPGDQSADPPVPDAFYVVENGSVFRIQSGRITDVDYATEIVNRPEIDNVLLKANNNTHEELELISEKDFTTAFSGRTDGMEFILPEGTPDNPIEITEINDSPEMKYADNYTSSNNYINTELDNIWRVLDGKIQVVIVNEFPARPTPNTIYFVETATAGVYNQYIVDSLGQVYSAGSTQMDLQNYVPITRKVGTHTLAQDITVDNLLNDIKDRTAVLTNKWIDGTSNTLRNMQLEIFRNGVVCAEMPQTPSDLSVLTSKAIKDYIDSLIKTSVVSTLTNADLVSGKAVYDSVNGTRVTGSNAFVYNYTSSQGYIISGDYDPNIPRQLSKIGRRVNLSFCCKGTAVANPANWTSLGNVPAAYKPVKKTSIVGQIYNNGTNEAAGGYVDTSGWVVLWTNPKVAGNNYQARINVCWDVE